MPTNRKLPAAHLVILAALIIVPAARAQGVCDRACLGAIMTRYLNAMVAHDPSPLPEAFKVYGGMVHAAEAVFEAEPIAGGSGWE